MGFQLMDSIFSAGWELRSFTASEEKHGELEVSRELRFKTALHRRLKVAPALLKAESFGFRSHGYERCPEIGHQCLPPSTSPWGFFHLHLLSRLFV